MPGEDAIDITNSTLSTSTTAAAAAAVGAPTVSFAPGDVSRATRRAARAQKRRERVRVGFEFERKSFPFFFSFSHFFFLKKKLDLKLNRSNAATTRARPASAPSRSLCSAGGALEEQSIKNMIILPLLQRPPQRRSRPQRPRQWRRRERGAGGR